MVCADIVKRCSSTVGVGHCAARGVSREYRQFDYQSFWYERQRERERERERERVIEATGEQERYEVESI